MNGIDCVFLLSSCSFTDDTTYYVHCLYDTVQPRGLSHTSSIGWSDELKFLQKIHIANSPQDLKKKDTKRYRNKNLFIFLYEYLIGSKILSLKFVR